MKQREHLNCPNYEESIEVRYLTDFEQGVAFAKTGSYIVERKELVPRCRGTKECDVCSCGGDESKCDFYPEKREKAISENNLSKKTAEQITGIMIKDMKMPNDCIECKMSYDGGSYCLLIEDDNEAILDGKMWRKCPLSDNRPDWCPLVEANIK